MCNIWRIYRDGPERLSDELSGREWTALVEKAIAAGVRQVDVTGGEPFLKGGVVELIATLLRLLGFTSVVTNAVAPVMTARKVESVLERSPPDSTLHVTVSIDGLPATDAELRGLEDAYERACRLLEMLREMQSRHRGLVVNVSFTLQRENLHELVPLLGTLLEEGLIESAERFYFRPVSSLHYYRAANPPPDALAAIHEVEQAQQRFGFAGSRDFIEGIKTSIADPGRMIVPCYALFASCWIDPYGNVSPCVTMTEDHLGNVREHGLDLAAIWRSERAEALRARIAADACPVCWTDCQAYESLFYAGSPFST
jgi:radical SAM protein with 4Fe4S-binding SPASM domain